jgi:hypothetical protein
MRISSASTVSTVIEHSLSKAVDLALGDPLLDTSFALDPLERIKLAADDGLRAILINDHREPVSPVAAFLRDNETFRPAIDVVAGVVLNQEVGGLNVFAAEHCLMLAGRLVSMPTVSSQNYCRKFRRDLARASNAWSALPGDQLTILDDRFLLRPDVQEILDLIAAHDAILDAGYIHLSEIWELLKEAKRRDIGRILVRDPDRYAGASPDESQALADAGVFIGFTLSQEEADLERFIQYNDVPRERLILHVPPDRRRERISSFADKVVSAGASADDLRVVLAETGMRLLEGKLALSTPI